MIKTIYTTIYGLLLLSIMSCEEIIEADLPNNQISTEQVFSDAQTAYSALSGLYINLRTQSLIAGNNYGMGALLGSYADDLDCYYTDLNGYPDLYNNRQQPTNTVVEGTWNTAYQQIYTANAILIGAQKSPALTHTDKQQITGEALLIRSLLYFCLQRIFEEIPYTTSLDYEYNRQLERQSGQALLGQLETDLTQAVSLLGDAYRDSERIYPNRKVAELLLAQVYLIQGKYAQAEQTALDILQSDLYNFQPDLAEVFHKDGKHILWQIKPPYSGDATAEASFYYFSEGPPMAYALSENLVYSFTSDDLRRDAWIETVAFQGQQWYRPKKYVNLSGANSDEYSLIYRIEEVYLLLAEAMAMQDKFALAAPYLNATRLRAGLGQIQPSSREDFLDEILMEKRREFFSEQGIRFMDLKRMGKLSQLSLSKPNWISYKSEWPYPQNELLLNPNLNPQQDGY
jgi:hypothetical protein